MHSLHHCHQGHSIHKSTGVAGEGGCLLSTKWVIPSTRLLKPSSTLQWAFTWNPNIFTLCQSESSILRPLSFRPFDFPVALLPVQRPNQTMTWGRRFLLAISLCRQNKQVHCAQVCPVGGFPFTTTFQGCPREELQCQSCPLSGDACLSHRTNYKPSLRLFFLSQHIIGNPMKAWVWVEREYNVAGTEALGKSGNLL